MPDPGLAAGSHGPRFSARVGSPAPGLSRIAKDSKEAAVVALAPPMTLDLGPTPGIQLDIRIRVGR